MTVGGHFGLVTIFSCWVCWIKPARLLAFVSCGNKSMRALVPRTRIIFKVICTE